MRRLRALVAGLPPGCALLRKLDPEGSRWSTTDELLARLIEEVDRGNRWFFQANTEKDTPPPDPIEIRRPGEHRPDDRPDDRGEAESGDEPTRRPATAAEMKAFFGGAVQYDPGG